MYLVKKFQIFTLSLIIFQMWTLVQSKPAPSLISLQLDTLSCTKRPTITPRSEHFLQKCSLQPICNGWLFRPHPFRGGSTTQTAMISLIAFYQDLQDLTRQCSFLCLLFKPVISGLGISSLPSGAVGFKSDGSL